VSGGKVNGEIGERGSNWNGGGELLERDYLGKVRKGEFEGKSVEGKEKSEGIKIRD
jgi:hypothetical protein